MKNKIYLILAILIAFIGINTIEAKCYKAVINGNTNYLNTIDNWMRDSGYEITEVDESFCTKSNENSNSKKQSETSTEKVGCGNVSGIPKKIPSITSTIVSILQVAVPVILILFGALDFVKGITSGKDDEIAEKRKIFIKRLITGAIVFFTIIVVKLLISVVADNVSSANISSCIECFINNNCSASQNTLQNLKNVKSGTAGNAKQQSYLGEKAARNQSSKQKTGSTTPSNVVASNGAYVGVSVGETIDLPDSVKVTGATYSSANTSIATVDSNGIVSGVARGETKITVSSNGSTKDINARVVTPASQDSPALANDISQYNNSFTQSDWTSKLPSYLILRVGITPETNSTTGRVDDLFPEFVENGRANNIELGVYYYSKATSTTSAEAEANLVIQTLNSYGAGVFSLPVYIDYEETYFSYDQNSVNVINKFCDTIEAGGYYCGVYSYGWFLKDYTFSDSVKSIWVADWTCSGNYKNQVSNVGVWQYSVPDSSSCVQSSLDTDRIYVNYSTIIINSGYNNFK